MSLHLRKTTVLVSAFVFAYADYWFSGALAQITAKPHFNYQMKKLLEALTLRGPNFALCILTKDCFVAYDFYLPEFKDSRLYEQFMEWSQTYGPVISVSIGNVTTLIVQKSILYWNKFYWIPVF